MSKIKIGTFPLGPQRPAYFDLTKLLETRLLVQGNSGAGKSHALRKFLEETAGQVQQLVIDPEGEFASLREKHDYVIAAAHDGDALAHPKTARMLARRLLETGVSAILDIYDLKAYERQSFVKLFLEEIVNAPKALWHPAIIVVDEAHMFCPEGGQSESGAAVIDLATRGRKRGFCLVAATQRLSKLHKDCAAELLNKLIGRTGLDVDVKRAADELGMSAKQGMELLRPMDPGFFYAFGPAINTLNNGVEMLRIGAVETTHPKAGDRKLRAPPAPTAAIKAILPKLADLQKDAETELRTVEDLRKEVSNLRRELTLAQRGASHPSLTVAQMDEEYQRGAAHMRDRAKKALETLAHSIREDLVENLESALAVLPSLQSPQRPSNKLSTPAKMTKHLWDQQPAKMLKHVAADKARQDRQGYNIGDAPLKPEGGLALSEPLSGPEVRILDGLAWLQSTTGKEAQPLAAAAFMADYSLGTGTFNNNRAKLKAKGLIEYLPGSELKLTETGGVAAQWPARAGNAQELQERILNRLDGPGKKLLGAVIEAYPDALSLQLLAARSGYTLGTGTFNNVRGRLKTLGLLEYPQPGMTAAPAFLFPGVHR